QDEEERPVPPECGPEAFEEVLGQQPKVGEQQPDAEPDQQQSADPATAGALRTSGPATGRPGGWGAYHRRLCPARPTMRPTPTTISAAGQRSFHWRKPKRPRLFARRSRPAPINSMARSAGRRRSRPARRSASIQGYGPNGGGSGPKRGSGPGGAVQPH